MNLFKTSQTFKAKKKVHHSIKTKIASEKLNEIEDSRSLMALPEGEDINEWLAINTVEFFNQINMLYGSISEFCTKETCPVMSAGPKYEYHWADGVKTKKPVKLTAPEYVNNLFVWIQSLIDNPKIFPVKSGDQFPKSFHSTVKTIFKRLFRVYAHIYHTHFDHITALDEETHLNSSFKHFIFFVKEFRLVDKKELEPLKELVLSMLKLNKN
ncbi:mob kinase activator-like 1 [Anaeramoeba ignava]|uniref:Mob kinase activator-like 1 n=1 Tax=Anaeramoeba ignava TaxID=1746090 RepID=A0A9Q0LS81_ANAIG|nr:mob kinase activator-like 1 [Anaeramoeba ignava]